MKSLTFASRNLEPLRGYHTFMRALPEILRARPAAQVIIAGGDGNSYSHAPPDGRSWKTHYLDAVISKLDLSRVHFVGHLAYDAYLRPPSGLCGACLFDLSVCSVLVAPGRDGYGMRNRGIGYGPRREVVEDRRNGVLVPFHDTSALAKLSSMPLRAGDKRRPRPCGEKDDRRALRQEDLRTPGIAGDGVR